MEMHYKSDNESLANFENMTSIDIPNYAED